MRKATWIWTGGIALVAGGLVAASLTQALQFSGALASADGPAGAGPARITGESKFGSHALHFGEAARFVPRRGKLDSGSVAHDELHLASSSQASDSHHAEDAVRGHTNEAGAGLPLSGTDSVGTRSNFDASGKPGSHSDKSSDYTSGTPGTAGQGMDGHIGYSEPLVGAPGGFTASKPQASVAEPGTLSLCLGGFLAIILSRLLRPRALPTRR